MQCQSNLRQIGIALHHHHDAYKEFPHASNTWQTHGGPSYFYDGRTARPHIRKQQRSGWLFQILQFTEQSSAWNGDSVPFNASDVTTSLYTRSAKAAETVVPIYYCPGRRNPNPLPAHTDRIVHRFYGISSPLLSVRFGSSDYAAVSWSDTGRAFTVIRRQSTAFDRPGVTMVQIRDGTAYTMVAGDKRLNITRLDARPGDNDNGYASGYDNDTIRLAWNNVAVTDPNTGTSSTVRQAWVPMPDISTDTPADGENRFGSSHRGGVNMLMADGSVQFITYRIAPNTWQFLGQMNDGFADPYTANY
jgi:prepilin-type processing-associated H-X9-DG protein